MSKELVRLTGTDDIARIRLQRSEENNKISYEMMNQFTETLEDVNNSDANLLVLEGEGDDFCTGRDQEEDLSDIPWETVINAILDANDRLASFEGISIAAVKGRAIGFGCGIAVQSDITLASETATFGFDEIKHGIAPKIVLSYLETYVNRKDALDLILTGRDVKAQEANRMGLASRVLPEDQFEARVERVVDQLDRYDPDALSEIKFFMREIATVDVDDRRDVVVDKMT